MFKDSRIEALFPTTLWIYQLENHEALNADLKGAIYAMVDKGLGNFQAPPQSVWQSEGALHIFPSRLEHLVAANSRDADRISVAFDAVLKGDVGDPDRFNFAPQ